MTDNSMHLEQSEPAETEHERFSDAYKRAMDGVTMSPELRERVLRLQNKKPEPLFLRVIRPAACAAACLVVLVAAKNWIKTENYDLSTTTTGAANEAGYSSASLSSTPADYSPEAAFDMANTTAGVAPSDTAAKAAADGVEKAQMDAETPESAALSVASEPEGRNIVPESESVDSEDTTPSEPYVLGAHTDMPETEPQTSSAVPNDTVPKESSEAESDTVADTDEEPSENIEVVSLLEEDEMGFGTTTSTNPLAAYDSVTEAEAILGWNAKLPPLPQDFSVTLISGKLLQIDWNGGNNYYRMAKAELGADISGDYNTYSVTITADHGYTFQLRGDVEDAYRLLTWQDGDYSYAYYSDTPMTADEAENLIKSILGA